MIQVQRAAKSITRSTYVRLFSIFTPGAHTNRDKNKIKVTRYDNKRKNL